MTIQKFIFNNLKIYATTTGPVNTLICIYSLFYLTICQVKRGQKLGSPTHSINQLPGAPVKNCLHCGCWRSTQIVSLITVSLCCCCPLHREARLGLKTPSLPWRPDLLRPGVIVLYFAFSCIAKRLGPTNITFIYSQYIHLPFYIFLGSEICIRRSYRVDTKTRNDNASALLTRYTRTYRTERKGLYL